MSEVVRRFGIARACSLLALACACACSRSEPPPAPTRTRVHEPARAAAREPAPSTAALVESAYLEGALLEASFETTALAQLGRSLPRPSRDHAPLVGTFAHVLDALLGDPSARLDAIGLRADGRVELSLRVLDGRVGAVRKLLGDLDDERDGPPTSEQLTRLSSEARSIGMHLRASLPSSDHSKLLRTLAGLTITDQDRGHWADACASLSDAATQAIALCSARPQVLLWARPEGEERLRVDAVYFFHDGAGAAELARELVRADAWASRRDAPSFGAAAPFDIRLHAEPTLALLQAEALADAAVARSDPTRSFDYHDYLVRERALRDLLPERRVLDGIDLDIHYDAVGDRMHIELAWLPYLRASTPLSELFEPVVEAGTLPVLEGDCASAQACLRVAGISSVARFAKLAHGPFSETTGAARILRQAGDRGLILLGLASWPNLLGTAGQMAVDESGLVGKAEAALLNDTFGFGVLLLELGDSEPGSFGREYVAYLRVGPQALAASYPAASLLGASLQPIELPGVDAQVQRGSFEDMSLYWIDEARRRGGMGGWLAFADGDARIDWLLDTPREPREVAAVEPLWYLHVARLGPLAVRERVAYSDDPPVRDWLDGRSLEMTGRFRVAGPTMVIDVGPSGGK